MRKGNGLGMGSRKMDNLVGKTDMNDKCTNVRIRPKSTRARTARPGSRKKALDGGGVVGWGLEPQAQNSPGGGPRRI